MRRRITGFHRDDVRDWVAELDCGHGQHVRHRPPFQNRPWVETGAGRAAKLGFELDCVRCDRLELPDGLRESRRTPVFTETSIPPGLRRDHATGTGVWALIHVVEGRLRYTITDPVEHAVDLGPGTPGVVAPGMRHHIEPLGAVRFFLAFHDPVAAQR